MKKKWNALAWCSLILALAIFVFTYFLYHHLTPQGGFSTVFQEEPAKPFITLLFGIWGVTFLFAAVMSALVSRIFYPKQHQ